MLFALLGANPFETYFIPVANGLALAVLSAPRRRPHDDAHRHLSRTQMFPKFPSLCQLRGPVAKSVCVLSCASKASECQ